MTLLGFGTTPICLKETKELGIGWNWDMLLLSELMFIGKASI